MTQRVAETEQGNTIGATIRSIRMDCGMTPEELGLSAQLSPSYIRKLEGGMRHDITLDTARKLARGLGVSPAIFFDVELPRPSPIVVPPANPQAARQLLQWTTSLQVGIATLLEEDERLRVLADAASEAVVVMDKGTVLFVNRALIDMLGLSGDPDQLRGFDALDVDSLKKYIAPGSVAEARRLAAALDQIDFDAFQSFSIDLVRSDGRYLTVSVTGRVMTYGGRRVYVALLREASWEAKARANTEVSFDWGVAMADMVAKGLIAWEDQDGRAIVVHSPSRILCANERAARLLGVDEPRALMGQSPVSFVSPGSLMTALHHVVDLSEGSAAIDVVTRKGKLLTANLRWQTVDYRGATVRVSYLSELGSDV